MIRDDSDDWMTRDHFGRLEMTGMTKDYYE